MFNLKTILRTSPQARREYRQDLRNYQRNVAEQKRLEAQWQKDKAYADAQQIAKYNELKKEYEQAFRRQGKALGLEYQKETQRALGEQKKFYEKQATLKELRALEKESSKAADLADKLNLLGTSIIDNIKKKKAKEELEKSMAKKKSSSSSRRSSRRYTSYSTGRSPVVREIEKKSQATRSSSTRSIADRILGRWDYE